jgi:hypothetical protein
MASTHGTVSYSDGQRGGERRCIPRRRRRGLPTEAVGTPALLKAHGTRQWDGAWRVMCPVVSDTRARRRRPLIGGPDAFVISKLFNHPNLKFELVSFSVSKILQILHVDSLKHSKQLYFLYQLQNPNGLHVINSRTNSHLNFP